MVKTGKNSLSFAYKAGNSFVHRLPCWIKILLIPALNILVFCLPFWVAGLFMLAQCILAFSLGFTAREQLRDLRPIIYYAFILYLMNFLSRFAAGIFSEGTAVTAAASAAFFSAFSNRDTIKMLAKLFCVMQSASILFKTSTSLQIREGIGLLEGAVRKIFPVSKKNSLTDTIALFVCFIPMVYKNWELAKRAWLARSGRGGIKMLSSILPVFFSVGIKQAYNAARAVAVRS